MRPVSSWWLLCAVAIGLGPAAALRGQAPAPETTKRVAGPAVEASPLDTFLLRDSKGNLVPVLGMPFEEFEQLLRLKKGLVAPQPPSHTLDALSLAGTVSERIANLQITATIRVRDEEGARVPLQMPTAVMRAPPRHEGPGEHALLFDAAAGGYLAWIAGGASQPHVVTLQASVGLASVGDDTRLAITLPRATESVLRLTVPQANIEAALTSGEGIVTTRAVDGERSEISVLGAAGDLQLSWRRGRPPSAAGPAPLDASGDIRIRVESESGITSDARLTVRSYGAPVETFQVRLPPGMELVPVPLSGYTLTPITAPGQVLRPKRAAEGQLVEVRLDRPAAVAEVRLLATLQADAGLGGSPMPARFDVLRAVRQRGTIDFSVEGEWQLEWTPDASAQRLDVAADAANPRRVARFEYSRQPCGLQLRVAVRPSRVSVEPAHLVHVEAKQLRLESTLKYHFRGARAPGIVLELADWKLDSLAPDDIFDAPLASSENPGQVQIPFRLGIAPPADMDLKLTAHRVLAPQTERIDVGLLRPLADIVAPAVITIAPADNVELTPLPEEIEGLSPEPPSARIGGRQQAPLVYRDLGSGERGRFVAKLRIRTRALAASARASVRLDRQQMAIEQRLEYRISHEPQRTFSVIAPRGLSATGHLQFWFDTEPLSFTTLPENAGLERLQFSTPTDQIGGFAVSVRYTGPTPRIRGEQPLPLVIPLVVPADEGNYQFAGQQIDFALGEGLQIEPELSGVEDELSRPAAVTPASPAPSFTWSRAVTQSRWLLEPAQQGQSAAIHVTQAWVQTWLSRRARQERVALRLKTAEETLRVRLPAGAAPGSVQAAIDAQAVAVFPREPSTIRIDLPPAVRGREFVLELGYALDPPPRRLGVASGSLQPAQVEGAAPPRRTYWQLALPEDEHLLLLPGELSAEMAWSFDRWLVGRRPLLDQLQLEAWMGASRQDPLPRGANVYLFGTLGQLPALDAVTAHRLVLVGFASSSALALGLLLLHIGPLRRPAVLLAVAIVLAATALAAPDLAVLAGQWSLLGVLIALAAAVWMWLTSGRTAWLPPPPANIHALPRETPSTRSPLVRLPHESQISTATAPAGAAAAEIQP